MSDDNEILAMYIIEQQSTLPSGTSFIFFSTLSTINNFRVRGRQKCLEKPFKICHIFEIRNPKYFFFVYHFEILWICYRECPALVDKNQGIQCNKSKEALNEIQNKYLGFLMPKK